jgi:hypothetical protein
MPYRERNEHRIADLSEEEQLAFGCLLRLLVSGELGPAPVEALDALAIDLGEDDFWLMLDHAGEEMHGADHTHQLASAISRPPVQALIYACLAEVAMAGAMSPAELAILEGLRRLWSIEERTLEDPPT